jgi:hypothetical protein
MITFIACLPCILLPVGVVVFSFAFIGMVMILMVGPPQAPAWGHPALSHAGAAGPRTPWGVGGFAPHALGATCVVACHAVGFAGVMLIARRYRKRSAFTEYQKRALTYKRKNSQNSSSTKRFQERK